MKQWLSDLDRNNVARNAFSLACMMDERVVTIIEKDHLTDEQLGKVREVLADALARLDAELTRRGAQRYKVGQEGDGEAE